MFAAFHNRSSLITMLWPSFWIPTLHVKEEALSVFFIVFMECNKKICLLKFRKYFPCKPGVNNWFKKNFLVCIHDFILFLPIIDKVFSLWPSFLYTKKEQLIKAFFSTFRGKVRHKFYNAQLSTYHLFSCNKYTELNSQYVLWGIKIRRTLGLRTQWMANRLSYETDKRSYHYLLGGLN